MRYGEASYGKHCIQPGKFFYVIDLVELLHFMQSATVLACALACCWWCGTATNVVNKDKILLIFPAISTFEHYMDKHPYVLEHIGVMFPWVLQLIEKFTEFHYGKNRWMNYQIIDVSLHRWRHFFFYENVLISIIVITVELPNYIFNFEACKFGVSVSIN